MSSKLKDSQLFFKNILLERIENSNQYKEYSNNFSLDLIDYDLYNEDLQKIIDIIINTDKLNSLNIRLSNFLTDGNLLKKLLRKISLKKQFKKRRNNN